MARRKRVFKKNIQQVEKKYNSKVVGKLINIVMFDGKKEIAKKIVYDTFDLIEKITKKNALDVFATALKNATPLLEVRSRRIGAVNYQIPIEVRPERGLSLGLKNIVNSARESRTEIKLSSKVSINDKKLQYFSMKNSLANEILDSANNVGKAIKKKEEIHKMAESNKANARYRW